MHAYHIFICISEIISPHDDLVLKNQVGRNHVHIIIYQFSRNNGIESGSTEASECE